MKFLKKIIKTSVDLKGYNSILIHSLVGCNLRCYKCHNYKELVEKTPVDYYTSEDILKKIKKSNNLFDALIISGGEFLIEDLSDIIEFLNKIREIFNGKIIINTNGTYPEKIKKIIELNLVDGFHMDIKFNIWGELDETVDKIIGVKSNNELKYKLLMSFNIIKNSNLCNSQFRTVKYPFINEEYFSSMYTNLKEVKWSINPFYEI